MSLAGYIGLYISQPWVIWATRSVVAVTLLMSGVVKVRDLPGFLRGVREYHLLPEFLVRPLASLVPVAWIPSSQVDETSTVAG